MRRDWKIPLARMLRRHAKFDEIIGVTGSAGKSTTTRLIHAILASRNVSHVGAGINTPNGICKRFLKKPRNARIWIQEISGHESEAMKAALSFVRPTVGVVTRIGMDHISYYRSPEAIAEAKGQLVEALPEDGFAILNADDPLVASMADKTKAKVVRFGSGPDADIRLVSWSSGYPERLVLRIRAGDQAVDITTRFLGERWITSVMAAFATAIALGVAPEEAAEMIGRVEPERFKDDVYVYSGVTFIADTYKAPYWTVESSIDIVAAAKAPRKLFLFGTLSDYRGAARKRYTTAARAALDVADLVIFYGCHAERPRRLKSEYPGRLFSFEEFDALMAFLKQTLRQDDLIYIKASGADHLERVVLEYEKPISCYVSRCGRLYMCNHCRHLYRGDR